MARLFIVYHTRQSYRILLCHHLGLRILEDIYPLDQNMLMLLMMTHSAITMTHSAH